MNSSVDPVKDTATAGSDPDSVTVNRTSPRKGKSNRAQRRREWLTETEVEQLLKVAAPRDEAMILLACRHGLRVSELCKIEWGQVIELHKEARASINVERLKGSDSGNQPLEPDEVKALRKLYKEAGGDLAGGKDPDTTYIFQSRDGGRLTEAGFRKQLTRLADRCGLGHLKVHPHMLRHTCGQMLVEKMPLGMLADYLGHKQIQNTRIYSKANGERFRGIWRKKRR